MSRRAPLFELWKPRPRTAHFLSPLRIEKVGETEDSRPTWRMLAPLLYVSPILGGRLVVPAGFLCDLASVPRDRKSTRLNSSHIQKSRMPSSA